MYSRLSQCENEKVINLLESHLKRYHKVIVLSASPIFYLKSYIERKEEEVAEKKRRSAIRQAALDIKKLRAKSGRWNGVAEIRKWRDAQ